MNRNYQLVVILDSEQKAEAKEKLQEKLKKLITDFEGKTIKSKDLGKKELAYPIAKKNFGDYFVFTFEMPVEKTTGFKQKIQLDEDIIRFLLIVKEGRGRTR
jgi:small subunit ribosomal protein S6